MSDKTEQPAWAANTGLFEETSRVFTYPLTTVKEEWEDEAEANTRSALSKRLSTRYTRSATASAVYVATSGFLVVSVTAITEAFAQLFGDLLPLLVGRVLGHE